MKIIGQRLKKNKNSQDRRKKIDCACWELLIEENSGLVWLLMILNLLRVGILMIKSQYRLQKWLSSIVSCWAFEI